MPSKPRPIYLPSADFNGRSITPTPLKARYWIRLHPGEFDSIYFSKNDDNRFSPSSGPCSALYVGEDPETCILERFGDTIYGCIQKGEQIVIADSIWRSRKFVELWVPDLKVCDLTDGKTLQECGVDAAALAYPDLAIPQAWAIALMNHPSLFDAICYRSRFTNRDCLAIFDRAPAIKRQRHVSLLANHVAGAQVLEKFQIALV